ncbi:hypothetical protein Glove_123g64 [Diversispora epigaea]|uniref:Uncharacterized protein n=1 Tax=Diversispora epigaea TaxID=1348612 RepID=A0A397IYS1_9GLOM|nr:hypothetical protein Glove_123g64 [Diversispora epigaea]
MNKNPAEIHPINIVSNIQDMEDIENINKDKENLFTSKDISKDTKFDTWDEVENYFDEYGSRNGFAIVKYRMERNSKVETALKGIQQNTKTQKLSYQDLANAIQKYKNIDKIKNDASILLTSLMQKKIEDLSWIIHWLKYGILDIQLTI